MRLKLLGAAALAAALVAVVLPGAALSIVRVDDTQSAALSDFDSRAGKIGPTKAQRALAAKLKVRVSWNKFGTPGSVSKRGKFLAKGIRATTAIGAARKYLVRNIRLYGLRSVNGLVFDSANGLIGSRGYTVSFRQVFGGLATSESGLVTIGVAGSKARGWKVAYTSSSLTRDRALVGKAGVTASRAWVAAANQSGFHKTLRQVRRSKVARGWTQLGVLGLTEPQQARMVAFPTLRAGVVPAYEALVLAPKVQLAYRDFVDAASGKLLARYSLVDYFAKGAKPASKPRFQPFVVTNTFSGELAATDGACGPMHGPYAVGAGIRALDGFAAATIPTNDVVLSLFKDGVRILDADTLFSPEQFHYEPAGGVPPGNYTVQVCDFADGAAWAEPRTYTGTLTLDDTPAPAPYFARWKAFAANPDLGTLDQFPYNRSSTDTRQTLCWRPALGCDQVVANLASRAPWDHDMTTDTPSFTTKGNNAVTATSWTNNTVPSPPQFMPTSTGRDYSFPWTNVIFNELDNWGTFVPGASYDDSAATVNLFVAHNRMHDFSYFLGFTEQNFNEQQSNFGTTERRQQNDPVKGDVQSGWAIPTPSPASGRDNANMITLPDGASSITNMYIWEPLAGSFYAPSADGDYDMAVIGHEYGHSIENRMIGKGSNRTGFHAGSMGEAFGDFDAMEYLNENGYVPTNGESPYVVGAFATGNKLHAIRNYDMSWPQAGDVPEPRKQLKINTLNFSDMGYDVPGPEVHSDGEIWIAAQFRIRQLLVNKYDDDFPADDAALQKDCANGVLPATKCPGNRRWIQLYYDAMLLMPTNPSMIQARDAVLAADLMRFGGANQKEIWLAFARSGFGVHASSSNTNANTDTDPTPDFESPLANNATVKFVAQTLDGGPIAARFFVGHYQARVSPIADTNPATTGQNLDDTAAFAPATYEMEANAPGYGHVRFRVTLRSGQDKVVRVRFPTNYASVAKGATATGDTVTPSTLTGLIDDDENTQWTAEGAFPGGNLTVDGKKVTVDLAGTDPVRIKRLQVSTLVGAGQNRFTALRQFEIWACNAQSSDCSTDAGFNKVYTSAADAFPGDSPRPTAPQMLLRTFDIPDVRATHLRLVAKTSQCTGNPGYQGDQDNDVNNNADCDTNVTATASRRFIRATELQAFTGKADVDVFSAH
jgi:extracellular elastinolytic metalloproteinase